MDRNKLAVFNFIVAGFCAGAAIYGAFACNWVIVAVNSTLAIINFLFGVDNWKQ